MSQMHDPYTGKPVTPLPPSKKKKPKWVIALIVVGAIAVIGGVGNMLEEKEAAPTETGAEINNQTQAAEAETKTETPTEAPTEVETKAGVNNFTYEKLNYEDVTRNPKDFEGKNIQITGEVSQYVEGGLLTSTFFAIYDDDHNQWMILMNQPEENRILEGDRVTFYGEFNGLSEVKTIFGEKKQVPSIEGQDFEIVKPVK